MTKKKSTKITKSAIYRRAFDSSLIHKPVWQVPNTIIKSFDNVYNYVSDLLDLHTKGKDISKSKYIKWGRDQLTKGRWFYDCTTNADVKKRAETVIRLYESMKEHGYDIRIAHKFDKKHHFVTYPITTYFTEDGHINVYDGQHRLSIMKYIGIDIMVDVALTTKELPDYMEQIKVADFPLEETIKALNSGENLYQPCIDKRVATYHVWRPDTMDRLNMIMDFLVGETVLDIGSSEGFFTYNLAGEGYNLTAIDTDSRRVALTRYLSIKEGLKVECETIRWEDYMKRDVKYDNILFLSVLHHSILAMGKDEAIELLKSFKGKARRLFLEFPIDASKISWTDEDQKDIYVYTEKEFIDILEKATGMKLLWVWHGPIRPIFILQEPKE